MFVLRNNGGIEQPYQIWWYFPNHEGFGRYPQMHRISPEHIPNCRCIVCDPDWGFRQTFSNIPREPIRWKKGRHSGAYARNGYTWATGPNTLKALRDELRSFANQLEEWLSTNVVYKSHGTGNGKSKPVLMTEYHKRAVMSEVRGRLNGKYMVAARCIARKRE